MRATAVGDDLLGPQQERSQASGVKPDNATTCMPYELSASASTAQVNQRNGCSGPHLHDHVQQALPPLHVPSAHQCKGDSRVEVGPRNVGKGINCTKGRQQQHPAPTILSVTHCA